MMGSKINRTKLIVKNKKTTHAKKKKSKETPACLRQRRVFSCVGVLAEARQEVMSVSPDRVCVVVLESFFPPN